MRVMFTIVSASAWNIPEQCYCLHQSNESFSINILKSVLVLGWFLLRFALIWKPPCMLSSTLEEDDCADFLVFCPVLCHP